MNEVSFRDSILDSIDTIVTESSNDVLFSLLDTADKAMMIMENCADTDDIWKYSIWQEADGNAEQIDKDKHPFKENSTLKTILMLPINLIKFIFKTISQAFSPQKTEEASKLQKIASGAPKVAKKVAGWFTNENGEIRWPVVITTAGGGALTIDAIVQKIRGKDGLVVKFFKLIKGWIDTHFRKLQTIAKRYSSIKDLPSNVECKVITEGDEIAYETNLNIEQAAKYFESCNNITKTLGDKIKAISDANDEKTKVKLSKELRSAIGQNMALIPFTNTTQKYTTKQITDFYTANAKVLAATSDQSVISDFTTKYSNAIKGTQAEQKESKIVSKAGITENDANSISMFFQAMSAVVVFVANLQEGATDINRAVKAILDEAKNNNMEADDILDGDEAKAAQEQAGQKPQSPENNDDDQYEAVTDKSKAPDGFPTGYFTKDADGKYVAVASDATWDANTTYYKKKAGAATEPGGTGSTNNSGASTGNADPKYDEESGAGPYEPVGAEKPADFDNDPSKYFTLNNGIFSPGKQGDVFEPNKWFKKGAGWKPTGTDSSEASGTTENQSPVIKKGEHITADQALAAMKKLGINVTGYRVDENGVLVNPSNTEIKDKLYLFGKHKGNKPPKTATDSDGNIIKAIERNADDNTYSFVEYAVEDEEPIDPVVAAWYNK